MKRLRNIRPLPLRQGDHIAPGVALTFIRLKKATGRTPNYYRTRAGLSGEFRNSLGGDFVITIVLGSSRSGGLCFP